MIFVDTNYFLRYFLQDIPAQYRSARTLFERAAQGKFKLLISSVVIFEINWVLGSSYNYNPREITDVLMKVINMKFIEIEERDTFRVALILQKQQRGLSLEDCYNLTHAHIRRASKFKTFDKKLSRTFPAST